MSSCRARDEAVEQISFPLEKVSASWSSDADRGQKEPVWGALRWAVAEELKGHLEEQCDLSKCVGVYKPSKRPELRS